MIGWLSKKIKDKFSALVVDDIDTWIKSENPYSAMTAEDKRLICTIGTSLNNAIRNSQPLWENMQEEKDRFDRLISQKKLCNDLVVFRGVDSIEYERKLAKTQGLTKDFLYHNGFVYTSLLENQYYCGRNIILKILIPADTNYLFTGKYSNTPETQELILGVGTILKIEKIIRCKKKTYIYAYVIT